MARRFFCIVGGVLLFAVMHHLAAERAGAEWDASGGGVIVGMGSVRERVWNNASEAYRWEVTDHQWVRETHYDLPVSVSAVKFLDGGSTPMLVTTADAVWLFDAVAGWQALPPVPGGPISARGQTFGKIKTRYR